MNVSRNAPCPCGSGKKYKKCCLTQDQKAFAEQREQHKEDDKIEQQRLRDELNAELYVTEVDELSNRANDLICSEQWDEAEACCRELLQRFPKYVDGHHRFYECCEARGDFPGAKTHAEAALRIVEREAEAFDLEFPTGLKDDIARFNDLIQHNETD